MSEAEAEELVAAMPGLTKAQRKLEVLRLRQEHMHNKGIVDATHRERMERMNKRLEDLPMHFDTFRTATAGLG